MLEVVIIANTSIDGRSREVKHATKWPMSLFTMILFFFIFHRTVFLLYVCKIRNKKTGNDELIYAFERKLMMK